ncbi:MAG: hypothetical protein KatS3mg126_0059 [Lysobacteraceae bacterium]|nr:MAG: hypothetical protein KatS3mg126_0059 [Xanthomonadaceae bacterium]
MSCLTRTSLSCLALALTLPLASQAQEPVTPSLQLRLRHEQVDDDAFARRAEATTLRARLGFLFTFSEAWDAFAEVEHTGHLLGKRFNSTANGQTGYPVVADPDNTELNQGWLRFKGEGWSATAGRQRLNFGNQRHVGAVGWRQNEQTFDALGLQFAPAAWQIRYAYLDRVQRIFGEDHPNPVFRRWNLDSHVLEAGTGLAGGRLTLFGLWHENRTLPATSQRTVGVRYEASREWSAGTRLNYALELAQQRPWADAPGDGHANYVRAEAGVGVEAGQFSLGFEKLGGDGHYAFQTPLATLHAFNGWADRFLTTPADGLVDVWVGWKRGFGPLKASIDLHRFEADTGSAHYGDELDAALNWTFAPRWNSQLKYAHYDADRFGTDVDKLWLTLEYSL